MSPLSADRVFRLLDRWRAMEAGRFILWVPVLMIAGVATYFSAPLEPPLFGAAAAFGGAMLAWALLARTIHRTGVPVAKAVAAFAFGFLVATIRTASVDTTVLAKPAGPLPVTGILLEREDRIGDQRYTIEVEHMDAFPREAMPEIVRVSWRGEPGAAMPGDRVRAFAQLSPPPGPAIPGGFDYGRQLWFEGIGGVGFAYGAPSIESPALYPTMGTRLQALRDRVAARVARLTPGQASGVAAALATGERDAIPADVTDTLRDTGLAHLLAISGLHMGLVCGLLFYALRFLFAARARWAARWPVRKWAAIGALIGGAGYLTLAGAPVSAQRAFIMAGIAFVAILVDRRAISLRNVALAAIVIIVLTPEAVMGAGFQMSFAAVMALVATYEYVADRRLSRPPGRFGRPLAFLGALFLTSLVAGMATSPMAIFHFNRIATFGLAANMAVMPLFTLLVMPGVVAGLLLMPLGLDAPAWWVVGHALDIIVSVAGWFADLPGAVIAVPQWSGAGWGLVLMGMIVLSLLRSPFRWTGAAVILAGLVVAPRGPTPLLYIAENARNVGVPDDRTLTVLSRRRERFTVDQWREAHGVAEAIRDLPTFDCNAGRCDVPVDGLRVAYTETVEATASACREGGLVVSAIWDAHALHESCRAHLLTAEDVARTGPVTVFADRDGPVFTDVAATRGVRPWVPRRFAPATD